MENKKPKDDRLTLRINSDDKKKLKIFCIENGFKNIPDFLMYCFNEKIATKEQNA